MRYLMAKCQRISEALDHDLSFVSDVRSHSSYRLQIIHSFFVSWIFPVLVGDLIYLDKAEEFGIIRL